MGEILSRTRCKRAELWNRSQLELEALAAFDAQIEGAVKCPECLAPLGVACHVFLAPDRLKTDGPHLGRLRAYDIFRGWITYIRPRRCPVAPHQKEGSKP